MVGLSYEEVKDRSPFELSGGQKRRVAIAGVIAMRPRVLILDEPTAGLDPRGKKDVMSLIKKLKETSSPTIVIISHDMDAVAENCSKVALFSEGKIEKVGTPREIFYAQDLLRDVEMPSVIKIVREMERLGNPLDGQPVTAAELLSALRRQRHE